MRDPSTSGENPATTATPGDTLRYRLYIENASDTPVDNFSVVDELDRLNATPLFQAGTLNVVTVPAGADAASSDLPVAIAWSVSIKLETPFTSKSGSAIIC